MPAVETPVERATLQADLEPRGYARAVRRLMLFLAAIGIAIRVARAFIPSPIWGDEAMLAETARWIARVRSGPEAREGLSAFLERRKPAWMRGA